MLAGLYLPHPGYQKIEPLFLFLFFFGAHHSTQVIKFRDVAAIQNGAKVKTFRIYLYPSHSQSSDLGTFELPNL